MFHADNISAGSYVRHTGCLPFTRKNRSVNSCSEWYASNPKLKFSVGCVRFISTTFSHPKGSELVTNSKWNAHFHSEIPFGNFGLPFKKPRFPEKISVRGDKIKW